MIELQISWSVMTGIYQVFGDLIVFETTLFIENVGVSLKTGATVVKPFIACCPRCIVSRPRHD